MYLIPDGWCSVMGLGQVVVPRTSVLFDLHLPPNFLFTEFVFSTSLNEEIKFFTPEPARLCID